MDFEWDNNKKASNKEKHGIDFDHAKNIFEDEKRIKFRDKRKDYGEERWITIGMVLDAILTVIYTFRNTVIRIISARPSNKDERDIYNNPNR